METWFWILGWLLSIQTMIGNGLIIFVVCRNRQLRTKTNAFVVSLAVADFCVGMSVVPSLFFCNITSWCDSQAKGVVYKVIASIRELLLYASAANLCSLVLDRYIAVVKPLKYLTFMKHRRVIQMVSLSWTIPVIFCVFLRSLRYSSKTPLVINIVGLFYTVCELLLCVIVIFCFVSMLVIVCKHARSNHTLAKQLRFNHRVFFRNRDKSGVKMMAVVICLFLVCYGLLLHCNFTYMFGNHKSCNNITQYKVSLVVLNSAVNPLAYAVFKRDIRKELRRLIYYVIRNKVSVV